MNSAQSEHELSAIVEAMPLMLFVKKAEDLSFVRLNAAGEKLTGISRQALIGKTDYDFFPKAQADSFVARDRQTTVIPEGVSRELIVP